MDTTATSKLRDSRLLTYALNTLGVWGLLFELWPYLQTRGLEWDPLFWYSKDGVDHVWSAIIIFLMWAALVFRSKSRFMAFESTIASIFVVGSAVAMANFIVVKSYEVWQFDAFIPLACGSAMLLWRRFDKALMRQMGSYLITTLVFWTIWEIDGSRAPYTGYNPVKSVWFSDPLTNALVLAGWAFVCVYFYWRVYKW